MIEIEKKFTVSNEVFEKIASKAEFLKEVKNIDSYFDNADYELTRKDCWLRDRNGRFELKIPLHEIGNKLCVQQYNELETDDEIRQALVISGEGSLAEDLARAGFKPFCTITTTRKKYRLGDFTLDHDTADFGYGNLLEVELMVEREEDREEAVKRIENFARDHELEMKIVRGKVIEWLNRFDKKHHEALVDAGVI